MAAQHLAAVLADNGLRPKTLRDGHSERLICPKCEGGSQREKSLDLKIDEDGQGAVWHCHRGTCGWKGNVPAPRDQRVVPMPRPAQERHEPPPPHAESEISRSEGMYAFFAKRGISRETVDWFGCYVTPRHFPDIGQQNALVFPYKFSGEVVNRKYRPPQKHPQMQEKNALPTLFNIDAVEVPDVVVWVEGEPDVMAIHEAGYPQVVSLKDGAPATLSKEDDPRTAKRFASLNTHAETLEQVKKFILAGDMDEPGMVLREELARRLGRHRCWLVTWPDDCKDACDTLAKCGEDAVRECLEAAQPYPIDDVQEVTGAKLDAYLERPPPPVLTTGTTATDSILKLPGEGRLIVVTGIPNNGKSVWTMFVMVHLMLKEKRRFLVFSPEMQPWEEFAVQCSQILVGKPSRRGKFWTESMPLMSREERIQSGDWLKGRLSFLASDAEEEPPTLDWILNRARETVLRYGVTDLLIDPWNEIEHQQGSMSETQYVGRCLQKLKGFANRHGCNVWIIAHPTKLQAAKPGEQIPPPGPYDISGSSNWANKADIGITVHTPDTVTQIHLWKSRFGRWGRKGHMATLEFDPLTGRYTSSLQDQMAHGADGDA